MKHFTALICAVLMITAPLYAAPLSPVSTWARANKPEFNNANASLLVAKGAGDNTLYVLEVDETTGELPVNAAVSFSQDENYGPIDGTTNTIRTAAQIGNENGAADWGTGNVSAQTLRVVVASDQPAFPLPTDAATETKQDDQITLLDSIDTNTASILSDTTTIATDTTTIANDTTSIDSKTPALGQALKAASVPVTLASDQGDLTIALPTGAATEAKQDTAITELESIDTSALSIDGKLNTLGQKTMINSMPVTIASDQSALPIDADFGAGTTDTATLRNVPASDAPHLLNTRHEAAATPLSVRISNGSDFTTPASTGRTSTALYRNDYTTDPVGISAYVELTASTAADINQLHIFDSSGQALFLATGAAASEVDVAYIPPGGLSTTLDLFIASGTRLSVKAVSATASVGELLITALR